MDRALLRASQPDGQGLSLGQFIRDLLCSKRNWGGFSQSTSVSLVNHSTARTMPSSGMLRHVALVRTGVSEETSVSIIRVTRIGWLLVTAYDSCHLDDGGVTFLRNVGSYKIHTA
jgi:hypothetical protein